jgi:hypothetical protein
MFVVPCALFANSVAGVFIAAYTGKTGVSKVPIRRPFVKIDLRHQQRLSSALVGD